MLNGQQKKVKERILIKTINIGEIIAMHIIVKVCTVIKEPNVYKKEVDTWSSISNMDHNQL